MSLPASATETAAAVAAAIEPALSGYPWWASVTPDAHPADMAEDASPVAVPAEVTP